MFKHLLIKALPFVLITLLGVLGAESAWAQEGSIDSGDTAWLLVSTLLVLMMTIPGLALFYGGLVKKDNVLAVLMQSVAVAVIVSVVWPVIGYSLAFSGGNGFVGGLDFFMLSSLTADSAVGTVPETVFIVFQMTFAVITIALLLGAVANRIRFKALMAFVPLWLILVYAPITHWVLGPGGFIGGIDAEGHGLFGMGFALDFAGGTVVHINSGIAGLVAAVMIGKSLVPEEHSNSNNLVMSIIGLGMLWVGWFGFNAGSALSAGSSAGYAMLVTNTAAGAAALIWIIVETMHKGKASVQGVVSGVVAGLVASTPAAGFVDFAGSLWIGGAAGLVCYIAVTYLKEWFKYDDTLDVFGLHGVGGIVGAILVGVFADPSIGGEAGLLHGNGTQVIAQILSVVVVGAYSAIMTGVILMILGPTVGGLRVQKETEEKGLDVVLHGVKKE